MRKSGKWMTIVDDRVLEYIHENEHGSPTEMKNEGPIRYSRQYIAARCRELADHGLLQHVGNGVYVITERGEKYLKGELDTSEDAPEEELAVDPNLYGGGSSGGSMGNKVICHACGYTWEYGGLMAKATCPSCNVKTEVPDDGE